MERHYNKLVRNNIPDIIRKNGEIPVTRKLSQTEYKAELEKKLLEEYNEVINAKGSERVEELADMVEVIRALVNLEGVDFEGLIKVAIKKAKKKGTFDDKIYLEKVISK